MTDHTNDPGEWLARLCHPSRSDHPSSKSDRIDRFLNWLGFAPEPVRSLTCLIDPTGTSSHVCQRNTGAPLQSPNETCYLSARYELAVEFQLERRLREIGLGHLWDTTEAEQRHIADLEADYGPGIWDQGDDAA